MNTGDKKNIEHAEAVPSVLRKVNIRQVLEVLRKNGPSARGTLSKKIGVSAPTMSKLINQLVDCGLVSEVQVSSTGRGRPGSSVCLNGDSCRVIGVVVKVSSILIVQAGIDGEIDDEIIEFSTPDTYEEFISRIQQEISHIVDNEDGNIIGFGICLPGLIELDSGKMVMSPNLRMLDGHTPAEDIAAAFDFKQVITVREEEALCLAGIVSGDADNANNFVLVDISDGLGMGMVINGIYTNGSCGFGGELGHMTVKRDGKLCGCGKYGCLETVATDKLFAEIVSAKAGKNYTISGVVAEGDKWRQQCEAELLELIDYLALGVSGVINIINPELVLIHAELLDLADDVMELFNNALVKYALPPSLKRCRVARSSGGRPLGVITAVNNAVFDSMGPRLVN